MKNWIVRGWFLAALLVAIVVGSLAADELHFLADHAWIRRSILFAVLFAMALPVEPRAFGAVWTRPVAPIAAILVNAVGVPLLGIASAAALVGSGLDADGRFAGGLLIACFIPCTLASASVWTRRAGGNDLVALAVTLVTNFLCFAIVPAWLAIAPGWLMGERRGEAEFPIAATAIELLAYVVAPMSLAQIVRLLPGVRPTVSLGKQILGVATQIGVLTMVLIGMIQTHDRMGAAEGPGHTLLGLAAMGIATLGVHVVALAIGWHGAAALGCSREDRIAVAIAGSQKTLMVGLELAASFGLSILPMITYHVGQLILDTLFADRVRGGVSNQTLDRSVDVADSGD